MVAGMIGLFAYFDKDKMFRKWVDDKVMLIPQLGQVIMHTAVANSFKVAASLLEGGVHLTVAMSIAVKSTRVPRVIDYWETAMRRSDTGDSVAGALMQPLLDNADRVLISAHKESSDLAESFNNIAAKRLDRSKSAAKKFSYLLFIGMAIYSLVAVAASLYVVYIQNSALLAEMKG
jgi:type II secretory pathway component PulF